MDRVREALEADRSTIDVGDALDLPREVRDRRAGEDLGRRGDPAESSSQVERPAPVPVVDGDRLPASRPIPTASGSVGSATVSSTKRRCSSIAARIACRAESNTAMTSSPRSSSPDPPRASRIGRATAANLPASWAAASSPCSCVKTVYPRTSAIRNVRMWASPASPPPSAMGDYGPSDLQLPSPVLVPVVPRSRFTDQAVRVRAASTGSPSSSRMPRPINSSGLTPRRRRPGPARPTGGARAREIRSACLRRWPRRRAPAPRPPRPGRSWRSVCPARGR